MHTCTHIQVTHTYAHAHMHSFEDIEQWTYARTQTLAHTSFVTKSFVYACVCVCVCPQGKGRCVSILGQDSCMCEQGYTGSVCQLMCPGLTKDGIFCSGFGSCAKSGVCRCECVTHLHTHRHTYTQHPPTRTYMHTHTHTCINARTQIHMYTYTHLCSGFGCCAQTVCV